MRITELCQAYFSGFTDLFSHDVEKKSLAVIKIISYLHFQIPFFVGCVWGISKLTEHLLTHGEPNAQNQRIARIVNEILRNGVGSELDIIFNFFGNVTNDTLTIQDHLVQIFYMPFRGNLLIEGVSQTFTENVVVLSNQNLPHSVRQAILTKRPAWCTIAFHDQSDIDLYNQDFHFEYSQRT